MRISIIFMPFRIRIGIKNVNSDPDRHQHDADPQHWSQEGASFCWQWQFFMFLASNAKFSVLFFSGFRIRIRIGSVFNRASGSGSVFGIQIRIKEGKNDPQK
jgi:hypothetical protein